MSRPSAPSTPIKRATRSTTASSSSSASPDITTTPHSKASTSTTDTPTTPLQPISLLPTTFATTYTYIHTALVLTIYYFSFPALVADPVATMTRLAPQVALAQGVYMVACLPVVSSSEAVAKTGGGSKKVQKNAEMTLSTRVTQLILAHTLALTTTPLLTTLLILLGAPLTSHLPHTFLLSLHLSLLTAPPLFYTHGVSSTSWRQIVSISAPFDEVTGAAVGTLMGAWLGAVPIPLDWDREWQRWPVTVLVGGVLGWAGGRTGGGVVGWGRKVVWE